MSSTCAATAASSLGHGRFVPPPAIHSGAGALPAAFKPRAVAHPKVRLFAPSVAGEYLLVLDIVTPEAGSLTAKGVEPAMIRVTVAENAAPRVAPAAPDPAAAPASAAPSPAASQSALPLD